MCWQHRSVLALLAVAALPATALACLWDYDTLQQERSRFPTTLELITGKFLRHSPEFYEWRIKDRLTKLKADPNNLAYHDDLAVAYEMTGQHAKAVETILAKEKIKPGLYETYSNLGTFHILAGNFEQGLPYIDKALAINPDAHFGRERYQKWLVEYAVAQKQDGKIVFPLQISRGRATEERPATHFQRFLLKRLGKEHMDLEDSQKAIKGVLGMMRFANHKNPLLLEALGDLLLHAKWDVDAKRLATRAYLRASYEMKDDAARQAYRKLAEEALRAQSGERATMAETEADFAAELAEGEKRYAKLREDELSWIREGLDADAEFDKLYSREPHVGEGSIWYLGVVLGAGLIVLLAVALFLERWIRRRSRLAG